MKRLTMGAFALAGWAGTGWGTAQAAEPAAAFAAAAAEAQKTLVAKHPAEAARIAQGVAQVSRSWREGDGDAAALRRFLEAEFIPRGPSLDATFARFEFALERTVGYLTSLARDLRRGVDLEIGPVLPLDERLGGWDPGAHLSDDLFANKVAFVALLNFPLTTLEERLGQGPSWSRRQWAEARLAQRFARRVPADVNARISRAYSEAESYISGYNVFMHHVLAADGRRLFPSGLRLLSHWNLRDEIKARYADPQGLPRQRLVALVMEKIVRQEIPAAVVNNPLLDWTPETGAVAASPVKDAEAPAGAAATPRPDREPDERYRQWREVFLAERLADPFDPRNPTFIDRRFNVGREIPEARVRQLLEEVLAAPVAERVARLIEKRLGRKLEAFDLWYAGFKPRAARSEAELDALT
ncbi:MAG TPA: hypothetical protein VFO85_16655, partial [Vicinamibacteria bacterium]|nr:hypothetical protein [Vicinamibacteria bacterium]